MILRWCLVPTCVALSTVYSPETAAVSTLLMILTFLYNELSAHSAHWLIRSVINAAGSASFEAGATLIICEFANLSRRSKIPGTISLY